MHEIQDPIFGLNVTSVTSGKHVFVSSRGSCSIDLKLVHNACTIFAVRRSQFGRKTPGLSSSMHMHGEKHGAYVQIGGTQTIEHCGEP